MKRIFILGEAPNKTGGGIFEGQCGERLDRLIDKQWHKVADGFNVYDKHPGSKGKGSAFPAVRSKKDLADKLNAEFDSDRHGCILFLGKRVADAAGFRDIDYYEISFLPIGKDLELVPVMVIPHPSGVVRRWNDYGEESRASSAIHGLMATMIEGEQ